VKNFILGFFGATLIVLSIYWLVTDHSTGKPSVTRKVPLRYHCPMHPDYISDKSGDCPICNMRLVPLQPASNTAQPGGPPTLPSQTGNGSSTKTSPGLPGYSSVQINPEQQQMMGITLEEARVINLQKVVRLAGRVSSEPNNARSIPAKFAGSVQDLFASSEFQYVNKGDPILSMTSQEFTAAQADYLTALSSNEKSSNADSQTATPERSPLDSARERLLQWDFSTEEIAHLDRTRQPFPAIIVRSVSSGWVSNLVKPGTDVTAGNILYIVIDLSSVSVLGEIQEMDLPFVKVGQPAEITFDFQPGKIWKGKVTAIYMEFDARTRTGKVKVKFPNNSALLMPNMIADIRMRCSFGKGLAVPESAVLSTGQRSVVFVAKGSGIFEPREVKVGLRLRQFYEIKQGLTAGEKVVTAANFLLDSESKLRAVPLNNGRQPSPQD